MNNSFNEGILFFFKKKIEHDKHCICWPCFTHLCELTIEEVDTSQNNTHFAFQIAERNHNKRYLYFYYVTFLKGLRGRAVESAFDFS